MIVFKSPSGAISDSTDTEFQRAESGRKLSLSQQRYSMKKVSLYIVILLSLYSIADAQSFEIRDGAFLLNGKPMRIYGGEMHYARIPRQYWQHRIQMAKAMGCNTLSIYVFWNYHETAPGVWDWTTESRDLRAFVETARAEGMYIVLRPGPYTCAEWEFGGFPYWMVGMKLRSNDPAFLDSCRVYLRQVYQQLDGLFIEQGGNIIMTQVENEYGSFSFDMQCKLSHQNRKKYLENLAAIYREVGFTHTLFTCDGGIVPVVNFARLGHIKGIFPGTNDSKFLSVAHHTVRRFYNKKGPFYIPEEYAGWFTHWGDAHMFHRDVSTYKTHIEQLLKTDFSFCYYMVHGGTNFGFWSGSNFRPKNEVWPIITSYDYGAPIDEGGNRTPLYDSLRAVYQRATHQELREVPGPIASMAIDRIQLTGAYHLLNLMSWYNVTPPGSATTFEQQGQRSGYVLYEKIFRQAIRAKLSTRGITDYALIYINDSLVYTIDRNAPVRSLPNDITLDIPQNGLVRILAENMGRVNFGRKLWDNARGATQGIVINGKEQKDWITRSIQIDSMAKGIAQQGSNPTMDVHSDRGDTVICQQCKRSAGSPIFYTGTFTLTRTADTYLDMHGFGKGVVFVNGHNLGRYWEIGPQYSLYVPGVWLKQGANEIVIFDQLNHSQQHYISATARPVDR
jgi:beta-galactosidase